MYSSAKRLSGICAIACALNIFGIILFLMGSAALELNNFPLMLGAIIFMATSALVTLMLTLAMRGLCQDLENEYESQVRKFREMKDQIKNLENKK